MKYALIIFEFQKPYFIYLVAFLLFPGNLFSQDIELLKQQAEIDPLMELKLKKQQEELEKSKESLEKFTKVTIDTIPELTNNKDDIGSQNPEKEVKDINSYQVYGQGILSQILLKTQVIG